MPRSLGWDLQQTAGSIVVGETEASSCNDDLPDLPELHGAFTRLKGAARPPESAKNHNLFLRRKAPASSSVGRV